MRQYLGINGPAGWSLAAIALAIFVLGLRVPALLGAVLDRLSQFGQALKHHRRAVELDPKSALAWNNMGYCLMRQRNAHAAPGAVSSPIPSSASLPGI